MGTIKLRQKKNKVIFSSAYAPFVSDITAMDVTLENIDRLANLIDPFFVCIEISILCMDILF